MKKMFFIAFVIFIIIFIRLKFGIYEHDEFNESHFFVKYKLIWKWKFYSPIGMSDKNLEDLNINQYNEQLLFIEFIKNQGLSK